MAPEMFTCIHILEEPGAMTVKFLIQEKQHEFPPPFSLTYTRLS